MYSTRTHVHILKHNLNLNCKSLAFSYINTLWQGISYGFSPIKKSVREGISFSSTPIFTQINILQIHEETFGLTFDHPIRGDHYIPLHKDSCCDKITHGTCCPKYCPRSSTTGYFSLRIRSAPCLK